MTLMAEKGAAPVADVSLGSAEATSQVSLVGFQDKPLDWLSAAALFYLSLPVLLFVLGWLKPPFAVSLTLLTGFGLYRVLVPAFGGEQSGNIPKAPILLVIVGVALFWSAFGGAGHFFYANGDWVIRDAVLRDLTVSAWPPRYGSDGVNDVILRAPIGYYLPAAALGSWLGPLWADVLLWLWTALGVSVFLALLPLPPRVDLRLVLALLAVVLFSGMDIIGALAYWYLPALGEHLEWWAEMFQYSSNTTQLFWGPNHALPAWIAAALFYRHWRHSDFPAYALMLIAIIGLWSPFAAIGIGPFYFLLAARWLRTRNWQSAQLQTLLPALAILIVSGLFLTLGLDTVPALPAVETASEGGEAKTFLDFYLPFIALECGFLTLVLFFLGADRLLLSTSALVLLILPLLKFGPGNDIVMRGSIPALTLLCIMAMERLQRGDSFSRPVLATLLLGILSIGAVTPFQEFYRAISEPRWAAANRDLVTVANGSPPLHYVASLDKPAIIWLLKKPQNVPRTKPRNPFGW